MANPQIENGHTKIANDLLEKIIACGLNGTEISAILFVIRKTYGFQKKQDTISLRQFTDAIPVSRPSMCKALKTLQLVKVLKLVKKGNSKTMANLYAFNKNYDEWQLVKKSKLVKFSHSTSKDIEIQLVKVSLPSKETYKRNTKERFLDFVELTTGEHEKLQKALGDKTEYYIERLDGYIGQIGEAKARAKYKSHYHTILNWSRKDNPPKDDAFYRKEIDAIGNEEFYSRYGFELTKKYYKNSL